MMSQKDKASQRLQERWNKAQKEKERSQQEFKRDKMQINETIKTEGWSIIVKSLQVTVGSLMEELQTVSSFRVFKGLSLRSEIRALKTLLRSMQKNEKMNLAEKLKE